MPALMGATAGDCQSCRLSPVRTDFSGAATRLPMMVESRSGRWFCARHGCPFFRVINPTDGMPFFCQFWRSLTTPSAWILAAILLGCGCSSSAIRRCGLHVGQASAEPSAVHLLAESKRQQRSAISLADANDQRCVDGYFAATRSAWQAALAAQQEQLATDFRDDASAQYHVCLKRLLFSAQKFGRLDPQSGLLIGQGADQVAVPIEVCGFPWSSENFQKLISPPQEKPKLLACRYARPGCGVPLVVRRCRNPHDPAEVRFFPPRSTFAATAL